MSARISIEVRAMNAGTPDEFQRVFFSCPDGHDMGSVPLDMLDGTRIGSECIHYSHRRVAVSA